MRRIGGQLDYARLAQQHRPTDPASMRAAALELRRSGLTVADISTALQLGEAAVRALLQAGEARP